MEVARLCRVSDATVKRWEEAGVLVSERTSGGHRRFRVEEVTRFQRDAGLGLKTQHGDFCAQAMPPRTRSKWSDTESELFCALTAGREDVAASLLIRQHLDGINTTGIFDGAISAAMQRIGELWEEGRLSVAQEHLATRTALNALQRFRAQMPVPPASGQFAMCCAVEGDFHELPSHLTQITLETLGWEVQNFGANTPFYSLADEALKHAPDLLVISATIISDAERLARDYRDFRSRTAKQKFAVALGGHAFDPSRLRNRFPAEFYPASFSDLAVIAEAAAQPITQAANNLPTFETNPN
jgi:excisionase family DNA binding protein